MTVFTPLVVADRSSLARERERATGPVAVVMTMGALHDGHAALLRQARLRASTVIATIFVNPLQFAANEDLDRYPRDEAGDLAALRGAGCDLAWLPTPAVMYPPGAATAVEVGGPAQGWEGTARPGEANRGG